jgi:hypothetical protein
VSVHIAAHKRRVLRLHGLHAINRRLLHNTFPGRQRFAVYAH